MRKLRLTDEQLTQSISRVGVLTPGLKWHGVLLDGRRRARLCAGLGVRFPSVDLEGLAEVAGALWHLEPERAVERFGLARGPEEFARLIGVRRGQVSPFFPRTGPLVGPEAEQVETISFRIPTALRNAVEEYCYEQGITFSAVFRSACLLQLRKQRAIKSSPARSRPRSGSKQPEPA